MYIRLSSFRKIIGEGESLISSTVGIEEVRSSVFQESYRLLLKRCIDPEGDICCNFEFCASETVALLCPRTQNIAPETIDIENLYRANAKNVFGFIAREFN